MTKTGKVDKLNKLNRGPFVEIHPDDAERLGIADGDQVEVASRRGRAVLPAVVTDRVRPGQLLRAVPLERRVRRVPDHQRRHQRRRRPGLAAAGVQGVRGRACARSPSELRAVGASSSAHRRSPTTKSSTWLASSPASASGRPASRCCRRRRRSPRRSRLWVDGLLAGPVLAAPSAAPPRTPPTAAAAGAVGVADRQRRGVRGAGSATGSGGARLRQHGRRRRSPTWPRAREVARRHQHLRRRRPARQRRRLLGPAASRPTHRRWTACGTRCSASATGPTTTSAATPSRSTHGWPTSAPPRLVDRAECEAYDDEPMHAVGRRGRRPLLSVAGAPPRLGCRRHRTRTTAPNRSPGPTRSLAPLCRNTRADRRRRRRRRCASSASTSPNTASRYSRRRLARRVSRPTTTPRSSTAGSTATGLAGDRRASTSTAPRCSLRRGADVAATTSARSRPNLLQFVAEHSPRRGRAKLLRRDATSCDRWLADRNGLDLVAEFAGARRRRRSGRRCWCG